MNSSASGKLFTAVLSLQHSALIYSDRFSRLLPAAGALPPHPAARTPGDLCPYPQIGRPICTSGTSGWPPPKRAIRGPHLTIPSVVATGGVDKGQGLNQRQLLTLAYWELLVRGK